MVRIPYVERMDFLILNQKDMMQVVMSLNPKLAELKEEIRELKQICKDLSEQLSQQRR